MATVTIKKVWPLVVLDVIALALVYFLPALSHLSSIPLYIIEPFRLMIFVSLIVFNNKHNALILAVTLPLFSFAIAAHPLLAKSILISIEMVVNVLAYSMLIKRINKPFFAILISIVLSKVVYYLVKFGFISFGLLSMSLFSTSLLIQMVVIIVTASLFGYFKKQENNNNK